VCLVRSCLYEGQVVHERRTPVRNLFRYGVYMWHVDLDELPEIDSRLWAFGADRRGVTTIRSRDHLGDPRRPIRANLDAYLRLHGVDLEGGPVTLLTNARVLGYVFNPLSVFYCHGPDGEPRCVVAEVHNTHGERHCYLLHPGERGRAEADKAFYVSPFLTVDGRYRMTFAPPGDRLAIQMALDQDGERVFSASLTGRRLPLTNHTLGRMLVRYPLMTAKVTTLIHLQGLRLHRRGLAHIRHRRRAPQERVG
jgi:uncharacterized protein